MANREPTPIYNESDFEVYDGPVVDEGNDQPVEPVVPEPAEVMDDSIDDTESIVDTTVYPVDPGDFVPQDYSFDVTVFNEDGKKPKVVKIKTIEDYEQLLDNDVNFGSAVAVMKAQRLAAKLELNQERDLREYKTKKDSYDSQIKEINQTQESNTQIASEINYLVAQGKLPELSADLQVANWSDPTVAAKPGIKEHVELLKYIVKENALREKSGLHSRMTIIDGYNAMQLDKMHEAQKQASQKSAQLRKSVASSVSKPQDTTKDAGPGFTPNGTRIVNVDDAKKKMSGWLNW